MPEQSIAKLVAYPPVAFAFCGTSGMGWQKSEDTSTLAPADEKPGHVRFLLFTSFAIFKTVLCNQFNCHLRRLTPTKFIISATQSTLEHKTKPVY